MGRYKVPADGGPFRLVMEKSGSQKTSYYLCGELFLGEPGQERPPQEKLQVRIPISKNMYELLDAGLEMKGKDSRIFVNGGLEISVKVPIIS